MEYPTTTSREGPLALVTLRELRNYLAAIGKNSETTNTLLCFSYGLAGAEQVKSLAVLLEHLAQGEKIPNSGSGVVAMVGDTVLCLRIDCSPRSALAFARMVRTQLQATHNYSKAVGQELGIGVVPLSDYQADPGALIDLACDLSVTARRNGHSHIQIHRPGNGTSGSELTQ